MKRRLVALGVFVLAAAAVGCGGAGGFGGNSASTPTPSGSNTPTPTGTGTPGGSFGGYVTLSHVRVEIPANNSFNETVSAAAAFYQPIAVSVATPALDSCTFTTPGATPTPAAVISRDAGSDVQLSGPASIDMPSANNAGFLYYMATSLPVGDAAGGATYSVSWPGATGGVEAETFSNALVVPGALSVTAPDFTQVVSLGGDLPITWTGSSSTPATITITTVVSASDYGSITCRVTDDGSFTVPGSLIAQLPSGNGTIGVMRSSQAFRSLADGSQVSIAGYAEHYGSALKP